MIKKIKNSIKNGLAVIKKFKNNSSERAGVYQMQDAGGKVLYVGKAKNLKKRIANYTHIEKQPIRLQRMIAQTATMKIIETATEAEALLLETNLIKKLKPKYNILMRDDKSFPHIAITSSDDFPRLLKHRGKKQKKYKYFGPFASAGDVNRTIAILQKTFQLRDCNKNVFKSRTRPCLQYQIKRCTAPCVGFVTKDEYLKQVKMAVDFLSGKTSDIQKIFAKKMQEASNKEEFEKAAIYRDKIKTLTSVQSYRNIAGDIWGNADIHVIAMKEGKSCILSLFYRGGNYYGNYASFPKHDKAEMPTKIMEAFIVQFYANNPPPKNIYINEDIENKNLITEAWQQSWDSNFKIIFPKRGRKKESLKQAKQQVIAKLEKSITDKKLQKQLLAELAKLLNIGKKLTRIEVYDNSHISGSNAVGAMIVATEAGFLKPAYRKFNMEGHGGDDYSMMAEMLTRRFKRAKEENNFPDLIILDGGKGQLQIGLKVLKELKIDKIPIIAVAKGIKRNAGEEKIFVPNRTKPIILAKDDSLLHFIQRLRDESHRFVIGSHRIRRKKKSYESPLDEITGIGQVRKQRLLRHFGSSRAIAEANIADLKAVKGISADIAKKIYDYFH